jgi:AAA+ ATPase superfamily predicted ATPase
MDNPFLYTNIVGGDAFCDREKEQRDLLRYVKASQNVLLYSHRRFGKTSLIFQVLKGLDREKSNIGKIYIDLYGTLTEKDFISCIVKGFVQIESGVDRLLGLARDVFRRARFTFSVDPMTNMPSLAPVFDSGDTTLLLEDVMKVLADYSEKRKLVVVFDEFQEISNYADNAFEKRLRKIIQQHKAICYIFSGSQRHILAQMFNTNSRAFYKLAESYPLGKIDTKYYVSWAKRLFGRKGVDIDAGLIEEVVQRCENHPMYVQQFLFHLWDEQVMNREIINKVEDRILERHENEFLNQWDSLTLNQKKTLRLIVLNDGKDMFYADSLQKVGLKSGSQVSKALETLMKKDLISKNVKYHLQDVMLRKWIERLI